MRGAGRVLRRGASGGEGGGRTPGVAPTAAAPPCPRARRRVDRCLPARDAGAGRRASRSPTRRRDGDGEAPTVRRTAARRGARSSTSCRASGHHPRPAVRRAGRRGRRVRIGASGSGAHVVGTYPIAPRYLHLHACAAVPAPRTVRGTVADRGTPRSVAAGGDVARRRASASRGRRTAPRTRDRGRRARHRTTRCDAVRCRVDARDTMRAERRICGLHIARRARCTHFRARWLQLLHPR